MLTSSAPGNRHVYDSHCSQMVVSSFTDIEERAYSFDNIVFGYVEHGVKKIAKVGGPEFELWPNAICMASSKIDTHIEILPSSDNPMRCLTLEISKESVRKVLEKINKNYAMPSLDIEDQSLLDLEVYNGNGSTMIHSKLNDIHQLLLSNIQFKEYWIDLKIEELILCCLQTDFCNTLLQTYHNGTVDNSPLGNALSYIDANVYSNVNLKKAADMACMSKPTFFRQFKHRLGTTPLSYIHAKRIKRAQKLLRGTQKSISEIGYEVGYSSPSYFSKQFQKVAWQCPKEYRNLNS